MDQQELTKFELAFAGLPPRRREVLLKLLAGDTDEEIAKSLGIHAGTVRRQISTLCDDFGLKRRTDLIALIAKYKPELLGVVTPLIFEKSVDSQSELSRSLSNPFIPLTGVVDNPKLFFDRKQETSKVFDFLRNGSSVAVVGEREIGKSSLLKAICREAESQLSPPYQPIYLNLQPLPYEDAFYSELCYEAQINELKEPIEIYQLVRTLRKRERPLLLAIDEVENEKVFTSKIRSQLRGLAEGSKAPLRLVIAASRSLDSLFPDEGMTSPLANICIELELKEWDEFTSRAFIAERLNSTPVAFTEEEISKLIAESGGHPQKLMQNCYETYARYMEGMQ